MEIRPRLSTWNSEVEIVNNINKEDICYGSWNSSLAVGSADSNHYFACTLLSLNGPIKTVPPAHGRGTEFANRWRFRPLLSRWQSSVARNHRTHHLGYRLAAVLFTELATMAAAACHSRRPCNEVER
jgi:hypothetical protein